MSSPTLVIFGKIEFTITTATVLDIAFTKLYTEDIEDVFDMADAISITGFDYLIPEFYDGKIIWNKQTKEIDPAYAAIDKVWAMKEEEQKLQAWKPYVFLDEDENSLTRNLYSAMIEPSCSIDGFDSKSEALEYIKRYVETGNISTPNPKTVV